MPPSAMVTWSCLDRYVTQRLAKKNRKVLDNERGGVEEWGIYEQLLSTVNKSLLVRCDTLLLLDLLLDILDLERCQC